MNKEDNYSKVIIKAMQDADFKDKLLKNPEKVLKEAGFEIPEGTKVIVKENTDKEFYFVLPKKPENELTAQELESIAGGTYIQTPPSGGWGTKLTPAGNSGYQVDGPSIDIVRQD